MTESPALLVDEVFPERPIRRWVLSFPYPLRFLFARRPEVMGRVPGIYRIAVGPHQGRKVFTLQTLPGCGEPFEGPVGKLAGVSLHAGVAARADQRH
jgi:hypothetical protein